MKYRKKPVEIDAAQWTRETRNEVIDLLGDDAGFRIIDGQLSIHTLEGTMTASEGDWIIRGVQGEFYPCKPDIFEQTYERAEESVA